MIRSGWPLALSAYLVAAALAGCKDRSADPAAGDPGTSPPSDQSFEDAMRLTCDAPELATELPPEKPGDFNRALLVAAWIDQRVTNKEVRQLMGAAAAAETPAGKLAALRDGARKAGIERCALAEMWQRMATGAAPPASTETGAAEPPPPSEPQTYDEAIASLCSGPAPGWTTAAGVRVTNPDVVALIGELQKTPGPERAARMRAAAAKTGIEACPLVDYLEKSP